MAPRTGLRTGAEYRAALRDGRRIYVMGVGRIDDVATHPATRAMVDEYVAWYDRHHDPAWADTVFRGDGTMFVTQGDRFGYRDQAQDLASLLGKIVRLNPDGSVPRDNPFVGREGVRPEIWSYGHRNAQAAALDPATGQLWTVEHGARGGDELNHPEAGRNYGWPVITYGRDYNGFPIGIGAVKDGMEQPVYYWDPIIAPSGMTFYTGDAFPAWKGSIFVGGLASQVLVRLVLENGAVVREERYLGDLYERIRDVRQGPDGFLYLLTDNPDGRVLRLRPGADGRAR